MLHDSEIATKLLGRGISTKSCYCVQKNNKIKLSKLK